VGHLKEIKVPKRSPRRVGVVESDRCDRTRRVAIHYTVKHPKYGKYIRWRTRLQVHDAENTSKVGDTVEIAECRPISKKKNWVVLRVIERAPEAVELPASPPEQETEGQP
jgi:small subunit ribosomal protein S17